MYRPLNIALVDIDNPNAVRFPNLVLMKASSYYKSTGCNVKLIHGKLLDQYNKEYEQGKPGKAHLEFFPDIVIKSKVFTWTEDKNLFYTTDYQFGGTGYSDIEKKIDYEIDRRYPDYDLYKGLYHKYSRKFEDAGIGFITRGCYRKCSFCFVPVKEGAVHRYMYIEEFKNKNFNNLILLDNNILSHEHGINEIKRMKKMGLYVDFNQGLDPHIISAKEDVAKLLSELNWINQIRLACDEQKDKKSFKESVRLLRKHKCKGRIFAYTIIMPDIDESYDRIEFVDSLGVIPYAQSLRDTKNTPPTVYMQALQKWVSSAVAGGFYAFTFEEYLNLILEYDPVNKRFKERRNRIEITKKWSIEHPAEKRKNRSMELSKSLVDIIDDKIEKDMNRQKKR